MTGASINEPRCFPFLRPAGSRWRGRSVKLRSTLCWRFKEALTSHEQVSRHHPWRVRPENYGEAVLRAAFPFGA